MYNVLIVEDEPWIREGIVEMVERAGPEFQVVAQANNGEEALTLVHELWPTILMTDIRMPDMDGLQLIRRLYEEQIPMLYIVISGYDHFEYARQAISYGVSEYLLKPVEFESIRGALRKSAEKLSQIKDLNGHLVRIQELVDNMHRLESKTVIRKHSEILSAILRLKHLNPGARQSLLRIYDGKLKSLLAGMNIRTERQTERHHHFERQDDAAIQHHFQSILDAWILHGPLQISQNLTFVIQKVIEHIHKHYRDDLSLTEMAALANLSISHFGYVFKQQTGNTLVHFINDIRVAEAKKLLQSTDLKVYRIAEMVGYSSLPYFTRVFKSFAGVTPNEYRKSLRL